jgi:hypothetical protein
MNPVASRQSCVVSNAQLSGSTDAPALGEVRMSESSSTDGREQFRKLVDDFLSTAGPALEDVVNTKAYGEMLGQAASNLVALNRINSDIMDLTLRNLRIAGRADIVSLHRQLGRNEDKLEMVLEIVERLEDEIVTLRRRDAERADGAAAAQRADEAAAAHRSAPADPVAESSATEAPQVEPPAGEPTAPEEPKTPPRSARKSSSAGRPARRTTQEE